MSVAIVTGGASGMGLALVKNLLARKYAHVVIADLNPPSAEVLAELGPSAIFYKTDVSSWDNLAALFKFTSANFGRLDLVALNAGISDTDKLYEDTPDAPAPLNMKTFEVDLYAPVYGFRLALWYMRRNPGGPSGKIIMTSSSSGFYAYPANPEYCAAKHGVVGLVRSLGPSLIDETITVNCICPGIVKTPLVPPEIVAAFPPDHWTPVSTIMAGFDLVIDSGITGAAIECSGAQVIARPQLEYLDAHMKFLFEGSKELFEKAYEKK
ncbi:hypothetical protein BZA70DRAFT_279205 [Myxozyma melibiosi]|uniref:NAD(P)-binding protein n=1 Tax=Myxozyma melibiosi TaxID=54550 RepID=A0ABR1F5P1_9ASCO